MKQIYCSFFEKGKRSLQRQQNTDEQKSIRMEQKKV